MEFSEFNTIEKGRIMSEQIGILKGGGRKDLNR
jgi:hypothetical protein